MANASSQLFVNQMLEGYAGNKNREILRPLLNALADRLSSQALGSAGLAIKAGGSTLVKAGSAVSCVAAGTLVRIAANTDQAALAGTVTNAKFNVFCFYVDAAGTGTSAMGIEAATRAAVTFPPTPVGKAMIGFVEINPTGTGNFVGGTTALDDATVVPGAVYVNTQGAFDPNILYAY